MCLKSAAKGVRIWISGWLLDGSCSFRTSLEYEACPCDRRGGTQRRRISDLKIESTLAKSQPSLRSKILKGIWSFIDQQQVFHLCDYFLRVANDCNQQDKSCSRRANCKERLVAKGFCCPPHCLLLEPSPRQRTAAYCFGVSPHPCLRPHSQGRCLLPG